MIERDPGRTGPRGLAHRSLLVASLLGGALLAGCSTLDPGPPGVPGVPPPTVDLASLPEPEVRAEPRSRYGNPREYQVFGRRYEVVPAVPGAIERGTASWYGPGFHGERTSSGETFDMYSLTAAHRSLPIPAVARVTNLRNGRSIRVRINDRGPFVGDRVIDLSYAAAWRLDMLREGTAPVQIDVLAVDALALAPGPARASATLAAPAPAPAVAAPAAVAAAIAAVAPPSASAPAPSPATPAMASNWLQAGAFASRANAEALLARLAAAGISNSALRAPVAIGRPLYRVHVGPLGDPLEVEDMIERLRLAGVPDARLAH